MTDRECRVFIKATGEGAAKFFAEFMRQFAEAAAWQQRPAAPVRAAPVRTWRRVFGYGPGHLPTPSAFKQRYRELALARHPDRGGTAEAMADLNWAREQAKAEGLIA